jgi:poly [ADP-ribose] polymerase 1
LEEDVHVYDEGKKEVFNVNLNRTDITTGANSFYVLQLLKHDKNSKYYVFRKWGRVGYF